jgi:hypothetical protein
MNSLSLGKMKGLTFTQYNDYKQALGTYNRVEAYNSNVSTMRGNGQTSLSYYEFVSYQEQSEYTIGLYLLTQNNPGLTFTPITKK